MISFYPGPSRVHDEIPGYVKDAFRKGILSLNHRSPEFMDIAETTVGLLKEKLMIPEAYTVFFTTSATECWEIISQSATGGRSYHIFNGAFGQKWFDYAKKIGSGVRSYPFNLNEAINPNKNRFAGSDGVVCITQNETSNGTQVGMDSIRAIRQNNPGHLLAIDATSSMAGIELDFAAADIWFASVQKCFGLPAGLGVMVCSPAAIAAVEKIGERDHYNSLTLMHEMMQKWQTPCTPNVLNIYLLMRVMQKRKPIAVVHKKIRKRYDAWIDFLEAVPTFKHLVDNKDVHSFTVIPVSATPERVAAVKARAKKKGFLLGEGYGDLKTSTFRIANFPALKKTEIEKLQAFLKAV